jgi:hypothetical protein
MWCGTQVAPQATYNVIRDVIGTRGGHMFLILAGGMARAWRSECLLYPITSIGAWPVLRKDTGCTVAIVTYQGVSRE